MMPAINRDCMTEGCTAVRYADGRGLCMNCYSKAKKMVEAKKTTWEELESMGLVELKVTDKFTMAFNNKKKEI